MKVIGRKVVQDQKDAESFSHIVRFCYRKGFEPISGTNISSDRGWGCCFRCCQGLVGQYITHLHQIYSDVYDHFFQRKHPLSLFEDKPEAEFSIHALVDESRKLGLEPGNWAKPSIVAASIHNICKRIGLSSILVTDFMIKQVDIDSASFPCLFLIPGLFGLKGFDLSYLPFLQLCLCAPGSLGFVSGKRNAAYYIAGFTAKEFAYFDPHVTRPAVLDQSGYFSFYDIGFRKIQFKSINPSILFGFVCSSREEIESLVMVLLDCGQSPLGIVSQSQSSIDSYQDIDF